MALYTIDYQCGHPREEQIYGTDVRGQRQAEADRRGNRPCPDCRRREANNRAHEAIAGIELPPLTGSDKQINWAESIRARTLEQTGTEDTRLWHALHTSELTRAAWWIEHRNRGAAVRAVRRYLRTAEDIVEECVRRTRLALAREDQSVIDDAGWRPGRGTYRPYPRYLDLAPARALRVWRAVVSSPTSGADGAGNEGVDGGPTPRAACRAVVRQWISGCTDPVAAALVELALDEAGDAQPDLGEIVQSEWEMTLQLGERYQQLSPPAPPRSRQVSEGTACRHGVSFAEDCTACGL